MRLWKRTIERMGSEAREVLDRQPPQDDAMGIVLSAWEDLQTERPVGFSEGRIPRSACRDWCKEHGMSNDVARILWAVIARLDIDELERRTHESKADRPAAPPTRR